MRDYQFTPEILEKLHYERFHHPHPRVQQKMEVVWLKSQGLAHEQIAQLAGVTRRSVQRHLHEFHQGGIEQLTQLRWKGKPCLLDAHRTSVEEYFVDHPPQTLREAQVEIERLTGIRRGLTQVRHFLKKSV